MQVQGFSGLSVLRPVTGTRLVPLLRPASVGELRFGSDEAPRMSRRFLLGAGLSALLGGALVATRSSRPAEPIEADRVTLRQKEEALAETLEHWTEIQHMFYQNLHEAGLIPAPQAEAAAEANMRYIRVSMQYMENNGGQGGLGHHRPERVPGFQRLLQTAEALAPFVDPHREIPLAVYEPRVMASIQRNNPRFTPDDLEACRPEVLNVRKVYQDTLKEAQEGIQDYLQRVTAFNHEVRFRMIPSYQPVWGLTPELVGGLRWASGAARR